MSFHSVAHWNFTFVTLFLDFEVFVETPLFEFVHVIISEAQASVVFDASSRFETVCMGWRIGQWKSVCKIREESGLSKKIGIGRGYSGYRPPTVDGGGR